MVNPVDEAQVLADLRRAREVAMQTAKVEPRAIEASYNGSTHAIVVRLNNGAVFSFSPDIAQGLARASPEDLATVEITPSGTGLHWEKLYADFTISGLLNGIFGTRSWMAKLQESLSR